MKASPDTEPASSHNPVPLGMVVLIEEGLFIVKHLRENGGAHQVGFQVGDQLMAVNGLALTDAADIDKVETIWSRAQKGERMRFSIERDGKLLEFYVEVSFAR